MIGWVYAVFMRLKVRTLIVFLALVRTKSMGKTAKETGTTQPSVSKTIAALETEVGVPLFERTKKGVKLTRVGRVAARQALHIEASFNHAIKIVAAAARRQKERENSQ
jgi:DNA-binding transcriptional LysR family regulator